MQQTEDRANGANVQQWNAKTGDDDVLKFCRLFHIEITLFFRFTGPMIMTLVKRYLGLFENSSKICATYIWKNV